MFVQERKYIQLKIARPCQLPDTNGREWTMKPVELKVEV